MQRNIPMQHLPSSDSLPLQPSYLSQDPHPHPSRRPPATTRQPSQLRRAKTLTRPERSVAPVPLITPPALTNPTSFSTSGVILSNPADSHHFFGRYNWWQLTSLITTWWAPPQVLRSIGGIKDRPSRQAWREKITLCWIILLLGAVVGFATMGLNEAFCPSNQTSAGNVGNLKESPGTLGISGWLVDVTGAVNSAGVNFQTLTVASSGQDITNLFTRQLSDYPACMGRTGLYATTPICNSTATTINKTPSTSGSNCVLHSPTSGTLASLGMKNTSRLVGYTWDQVAGLSGYMVINGVVLNMQPYLDANPKPVTTDTVDTIIRSALSDTTSSGKDVTRMFLRSSTSLAAINCMHQRYIAGRIDKVAPGCFFSGLFLYASLIVILGVVFTRFIMAVVFNWFLSARLCRPPSESELRRKGISPSVMPEGANVSIDNGSGTAPWASGGKNGKGNKIRKAGPSIPTKDYSGSQFGEKQIGRGMNVNQSAEPLINLSQIGAELFAVCLVTCYSEGEVSIRSTLESIANTSYSDSRKLLFIVCDGMITGEGEKISTPDVCVGMLDADPRFGEPMPMGYIAVGNGAKRENRAMVYAGHYVSRQGRRTPAIVVVKCGVDTEATGEKQGNRGKRDSQLLLMNFFSRVTYNDRMSPLDFDLFRKIQVLMGVTPDYFEVVLMVDADTKIYPDALTHLVNCMHHDNMIMGVCGETRIANKRQSWVTAIQVYEYFISHHLSKAFESVFGGVTCLPGCFSMYRLKARRPADDDWIPILVKPEIVKEYSMSDVTTLHQKNLLLLGEDRFLSTLMLRTFPKRKMMFCPQARCHTVAPDTFSVLLSQRRRWINSTIHNLLELVRVQNLCGTFCFSMQFVVFMDLLGTVVLPVAICLTYTLIIRSIISPPENFQEWIPLLLLVTVIGLPAILILITTRKVIYVAWMLIYLLALPVWNFILPVYSFWHFDDFSWGETRRVQGEVRSKKHGDDKTAVFDGTSIPLRRWEDWERSRLRKLRREAKRRQQMERSLQAQSSEFWNDSVSGQQGGQYEEEYGQFLRQPRKLGDDPAGSGSETGSIFSDEDVWGAEIGGYNEFNNQFPPPPIALLPPDVHMATGSGSNGTIGADEMQAMLEEGFDDRRTPTPQAQFGNPFGDTHQIPSPLGYRQPPPPMPVGSVFGYNQPRPPAVTEYGRSISSAVEPRAPKGHAKRRSGGGAVGQATSRRIAPS